MNVGRLVNEVEATVYLANGLVRRYAWTTPRPFGYCFGAGRQWAKAEMTKDKTQGRSNVVGVTVTVRRTNRRWEGDSGGGE